MRHSILHTIVVSLLAVAVAGCAKDVVPTGPMPGASHDRLPVEKLDPIGIDPNAYVTIVAGKQFTCARRNDNTVYCWGVNNLSQTGSPSMTRCFSRYPCLDRPTVVMGSYFDTIKVVQIDAGSDHACGLDNKGTALCWGSSEQGQRAIAGQQTSPPLAAAVDSMPFNTPLGLTSSMSFTSIGAGGNSTCATTAKNGMFCWGVLGDTSSRALPIFATSPVQISPVSPYFSVAVGPNHACALLVTGRSRSVDCWGDNLWGQLGMDVVLTKPAPYTEASEFGGAVNGVTTENDFTCVDQESGVVECAGRNDSGQLGNGQIATGMTGKPQTVGNSMSLHGVTTGYTHACALDDKNAAWCWGNGNHGQLGNGATGVFSTPQAVVGGGTYVAIAAGELHTCAIGTDRLLYCWGSNRSGELGIGGTSDTLALHPMRVVAPRS